MATLRSTAPSSAPTCAFAAELTSGHLDIPVSVSIHTFLTTIVVLTLGFWFDPLCSRTSVDAFSHSDDGPSLHFRIVFNCIVPVSIRCTKDILKTPAFLRVSEQSLTAFPDTSQANPSSPLSFWPARATGKRPTPPQLPNHPIS